MMAHLRSVKPYKGLGMEGWVARWYTRTRRNDIEDFRGEARAIAALLPARSKVLEVAPGPGFFGIALASLGNFNISGLDISRTLVEIAKENARSAGVKIDFRLGNAAAMPFADETFDMIYCSAAFKNFTEPVRSLDEMHRVLRPGGTAVVVDLCKDTPLSVIDTYVEQSGRSRVDAWITKWTFRHLLLKRAYTKDDFMSMAQSSRFANCEIASDSVAFRVRFRKSARGVTVVA